MRGFRRQTARRRTFTPLGALCGVFRRRAVPGGGGWGFARWEGLFRRGFVRCPKAATGTLYTGGLVSEGVCTLPALISVQSPVQIGSSVYKAACLEKACVQSPVQTGAVVYKAGLGCHRHEAASVARSVARGVPPRKTRVRDSCRRRISATSNAMAPPLR